MFQTELIHALQSLESGPLTALMVAVTYLGYGASFFVLAVVLLFGVDFRKGYVLAQVLVWNAVWLYFAKNQVALPRPVAVDPTVALLGSEGPVPVPPEWAGAPGFWDALPGEVVAYHRGRPDPSQGFPSGHVSTTVACWGTLAWLYPYRWLAATAAGLMVLMPFSRMYLGQHFLADVLGGFVLGALVLAAAYGLALRGHRWRALLAAVAQRWPRVSWGQGLYLFAAPLLLLFLVPAVHVEDPARLLGLNLGFWLVAREGLPQWSGRWGRRAARVGLALGVYAASSYTLHRGGTWLLGVDAAAWTFGAETASIVLMVWGTTAACRRLGLV